MSEPCSLAFAPGLFSGDDAVARHRAREQSQPGERTPECRLHSRGPAASTPSQGMPDGHRVAERDDLSAGIKVGPVPIGLDFDEAVRSEEHTSELQSPTNLVCR